MRIAIASCTFLVLFFLVAATAYAQDRHSPKLDTVESCRAYRDAWHTSVEKDVKALTVRELLYRSDQLTNCVTSVDAKLLEYGVTPDEAITITIRDMKYPVLVARYRLEVIDRLIPFLKKKGLAKTFVAEDEKGRKQ